MLVLTRKLEEVIVIGGRVEVHVLGIQGDQVRLGFSAPRDIPIFRKEVFEEIQAENLRAARPTEVDVGALAGSLRDKSGRKDPETR